MVIGLQSWTHYAVLKMLGIKFKYCYYIEEGIIIGSHAVATPDKGRVIKELVVYWVQPHKIPS